MSIASTNRRQFERLDWIAGLLVLTMGILHTSPVLAIGGASALAPTALSAISIKAGPGYDPGLQLQAAEVNVFVKRAIFSWPAGSGAPSGGGGENNPEAATPGHL